MLMLISDMKLAADTIEKIAFDMPPPNAFTPQFVQIAQTMRKLAIEAEVRRLTNYKKMGDNLPQAL